MLINSVLPQGYSQVVELSEDAKRELTWWSQEAVRWNSAPIIPPQPELIIETNASWQDGGLLQGSPIRGSLGQGRAGDAHQCTGTPGSQSCSAELCQEQEEYGNPHQN